MAMPSGRFFGLVIGGTHPAALAADWLVSAWDQNAGLRPADPGRDRGRGGRRRAGCSTCSGCPPGSAVGFVTGGTMANFTCLAAGRDAVLRRAGWDVAARRPGRRARGSGCSSARSGTTPSTWRCATSASARPSRSPPTTRAGSTPAPWPARSAERGRARRSSCLQAGNLHSGAFDPFAEAIEVAHAHGAWVHVDGAFGLFAAAVAGVPPPDRGLRRRRLVGHRRAQDPQRALRLRHRDRRATRAALQAAMGMHGDYLIQRRGRATRSRRCPSSPGAARGVPVWAVLRCARPAAAWPTWSSGLAGHAAAFAAGIAAIAGAEVLNDVVFTQVCVASATTSAPGRSSRRLLADGTAWMSGSRWHGRAVLRISVSNWSTTESDVRRSLRALERPRGLQARRIESMRRRP